MQPDVRPGPPDPTIGPDSLSGALPALPQWLLTDPKPACSRLPWPSCTTHIPNPLAMGEFTNVLKRAGICEPGVVPIPGASVLLPWGVLLSERLAAQVRAAYGRLELYEYAYPHVVAQSCSRSAAKKRRLAAHGYYFCGHCAGLPELIFIATGSEVELAVNAADQLTAEGRKVRVVSMPATEVFEIGRASCRERV